jgi:hypothetical protein
MVGMENSLWPNLVYTSIRPGKWTTSLENNGEVQFATGQSSRDLRASSGYRQRLPVRIMFAPRQDPNHLLHPGMSVEPTVWLQ